MTTAANPKFAADLVVRRTLNAPPRMVFRAWTEPEFLARWSWGRMHETLSVSIDLRPGGLWRQQIRNAKNGEIWSFEGEIREVVPNTRLVHTFSWRSDKGLMDGPSLVAIDFIDRGDKTDVVITHSQVPTDKEQAGHETGWNEVLDSIAATLSS